MKRREFVRISGATAAALATPRMGWSSPAQNPVSSSPSEKVVFGVIGVGGRGTAVMHDFLRHKDVEVAAICDVDSEHLGAARQSVARERGRPPETFADYRKLLERKDLDAVIVGTPDHWHALPTIHACEAGLDVYVEKPLSHNYVEGVKMIEAARDNKRVTQMGIQIHNDAGRNYARVVETIRGGLLGKITKVRCWKADHDGGIGSPPDGAAPKNLDYDTWLGPAPERPYNPNRSHFNFRYFWDYAGGKFSDFGCHIMDIAYWSLGIGPANSATAAGGKFSLEDNSETPDTLEVIFEYDDLTMVWSQTVTNSLGFYGMGGIGCVFQGTDATLVTNYTDHKIFAEGGGNKEMPKPEIELPPYVSHSREFLDSIKSRELASCDIEYGHALTTNVHLGNISYRTGTKVVWDAERGRIVKNRAANALLGRKYRRPWKI